MRKNYLNTIDIIKGAFLIFLPLVILSLAIIFMLYQKEVDKDDALIRRHIVDHIDILKEIITNELNLVKSDLLFLAQHSMEYQEHRVNYHQYQPIYETERKFYENFSKHRKIYDKIHFLDLTGAEILRIDYNHGNPQGVPKSQLQSTPPPKFATISQLTTGKIYISPFAMNTEENSLKLMIQVGVAVFDDNRKKIGTLLLTYPGEQLLQNFERILVDTPGEIILLNSEGHWIKGKKPSDKRISLFSESPNHPFPTLFPDEWQLISTHHFGQFMNAEGLFTFLTIYPNLLVESPLAPKTAIDISQLPPSVRNNYWKIVSQVPPELLFIDSQNFLHKLTIIYIPLVIFMGIGSVALSFANRNQRWAEQRLREELISYSRFVPQEFLQLLKKDKFSEVQLADHVQQQMTIFFSDIRSYTKLSESMSAVETFNFLNSYFKQISPPIRKNYGFIDKFIGDAVMAIFPNPQSPYEALSAVIALKRHLVIYNQNRRETGLNTIEVGFGLHYGEVTLGTIGSLDRMETTVIGDTVNLAARLESLTKVFKIDIILSDSVYNRLPEVHGFHLREIDTVRVKGKDRPVKLYEAFDTNDPAIFEQKQTGLLLFQQAISNYKAGHFQEAMSLFEQCQAQCPEDPLPHIYIKRCNTLIRVPPGTAWTGISTL